MFSIFGELERFLAELYPYRWPLTVGAIAAISAAAWFAVQRGWHLIARRIAVEHTLATVIAAVVFLAIAVPAGDYLLSPLFERSFLEESSPLAVAVAVDAAEASNTPAGVSSSSRSSSDLDAASSAADVSTARVTHQGTVVGADDFHFGRGRALLVETAPNEYTLRFEDFSVRNGPDLFVYLSPNPDGYAHGALNLGELKATDGSFNYDIPPGTDISQFKSAIVWCKQFSVLFAAAPLIEQ